MPASVARPELAVRSRGRLGAVALALGSATLATTAGFVPRPQGPGRAPLRTPSQVQGPLPDGPIQGWRHAGDPSEARGDASQDGDFLTWWRTGLAALGCAAALAVSAPAPDQLQLSSPALAEVILNSEEKQTVSLFERNTPGVVFITSEVYQISNAYAQQMEIRAVPKGTGTGWVYDGEGHIITNYHVIEGANALIVRFIEGTEVPAKVVGADPGTDVAVLQVDLPKQKQKDLVALKRGESAPLSVGQEVYAIGNPFGLDHTLTKGIVSGVGRTIMSVGGRPIQGAIQTDASINPGNSGGPLLNSQGEVIGMNTVIISPTGASAGVGFAIPVDTVAARTASILKYGYVKRPSLGIYLAQDGIAKRLSGQDGGYVVGTQEVSAANEAGIKTNDIITKIDNRRIKKINDIYAALDEREPGQTVTVTLLRPDVDPRYSETRPVYTERQMEVKLLEAPQSAPNA